MKTLQSRSFQPYQQVYVNVRDELGYQFYGEVMSYPFAPTADSKPLIHHAGEQLVKVRRVINDATTMVELPVDILVGLAAADRLRYVHYALVRGVGSFPVDMLRYDSAAPVDFELDPEYPYTRLLAGDDRDVRLLLKRGPGLLIARATKTRRPEWCTERWHSFLWHLDEVKTVTVEGGR